MPRTVPWIVVLGSAIALGQTAQPSFDVATVKASAPMPVNGPVDARLLGIRGGPGTPNPGQIAANSMPLRTLLFTAYGMHAYQITGPAWLDTQRFDVVATVPDGATKDQVQGMWRNLLIERFGLQAHIEQKDAQISELVVGKDGHKMKPSATGPAAVVEEEPSKIGPNFELSAPGLRSIMYSTPAGITGRVIGKEQPMAKLADLLSAQLKRPVVDKTGLAGNYDFTFEFAPETQAVPGNGIGQDIGAAVQQLGLRLVTMKGKIDPLVVDKMEKVPTEN
jgi:uncharacterized protein (TIGR03435 family)